MPISSAAGGEKRLYEVYAASVGLQEHEMASTLKVLRGDNAHNSAGMYYYGQNVHGNNHKQWGYEDEYQMRIPSDSYHPEYMNDPSKIDLKNNRLSQHAMQTWDSVRLVDKRDGRERDSSTSHAVSSLAFLYGSSSAHTLPVSSVTCAPGSSSDGNRSPDSDDPSEAATDNSQSSGSLCDSKGSNDRSSISSVSVSGGEGQGQGQHKRGSHMHAHHVHAHHGSSANTQWPGGGYPPDPSCPPDSRKQSYPYDRDAYGSIYPAYLQQSRPHTAQIGYRPPAPHQLLYGQQVHGQIHSQSQVQTQAQMMHARYLNYQQNVRQGQGKDMPPKVAPITIPTSNYPMTSKSQPVIATLMDDHAHWASKPLVVKNLSPSVREREEYEAHAHGHGVETDSEESHGKGMMMPILISQAQAALIGERDDMTSEEKYVVLMPMSEGERYAPSSYMTSHQGGADLGSIPNNTKGSNMNSVPRTSSRGNEYTGPSGSARVMSNSNTAASSSSEKDRKRARVTEGEQHRLEEGEEEMQGGNGNLVLDEPLGDATHALLSFCMQRNPWMYSPSATSLPSHPTGSKEGGECSVRGGEGMQGGLAPGATALFKDVLSCLMDTPLLREELDCYTEALNPSPFPPGSRKHRRRAVQPPQEMEKETSSVSPHKARGGRWSAGRVDEKSRSTRLKDHSSSDERERESSEGDLTDDSRDSQDHRSVHRSRSYCSMARKRDAVEEMRAFTTFASLRMQEVCDLVCEQESRRAARRELDRREALNNWAFDRDGSAKDQAASESAAAFVKALETCTETWWAYANIYK